MGKYLDKAGLSRLWSKIKGAFLPKVGSFKWTKVGNETEGYVAFGQKDDAVGLSGQAGIAVVGDDKVMAAIMETVLGEARILLLNDGAEQVLVDSRGIHIAYSGSTGGVDSKSCTIHFFYNNKTYGFDVENAIRAGILMEE